MPILFAFNYVGSALMLPAIIELVLVFPIRLLAPTLERRFVIFGRVGALVLVPLALAGNWFRDWFALAFTVGVGLPSAALVAALAVWAWAAVSPRFTRKERAQTRLVWAGLAVSLSPSVFYSLTAMTHHALPGFEFAFMGFCAFPAAIAIAIVKHQTFEIERLVRRATLYTLLTVALAGLYAVCVAIGHHFLGGWNATSQAESLLGFGAALLLALALRPFHDRLRQVLDRRFFGQRADPLRAAAELGRRAATGEVEALAQELARSIREALCDALTTEGYEVSSAPNGREALELLNSSAPPI